MSRLHSSNLNTKRPMSLINLSNSLCTRYRRDGRPEDLEEAIESNRSALNLFPEGHPSRSTPLNNLASSLLTRGIQHGRTNDIEEAIGLNRAALELRHKGHPGRSTPLNNLARSLIARYNQRGRVEDLDEAIELNRAALKDFPEGHPFHCISLSNLASPLSTRYRKQGKAQDLKEAIELNRAAAKLCTKDHPSRSFTLLKLVHALYDQIKQQWHEEEFEECMQLSELAATHRFSDLLDRLRAARVWAGLARSHNHHSTFTAYKTTVSILQYALTINPTLCAQHDFFIEYGEYRLLTIEAASYAIEKSRLEQAVEILEQGRGLLWSQLYGFRMPLDQLAGINRELADRFRDVSRRLENLVTIREVEMSGSALDASGSVRLDVKTGRKSFDKLLKLKKQLSSEQESVVNEIRQVPGFEGFLEATPFKRLQNAASEGPVIMVNHCKYRSDALIVLSRDDSPVVCVPLDKRLYTDSIELSKELVETRRQFKTDSPEYDRKLREAMKALWDRVVSKVVDKLTEIGVGKGARIWWCPTSVLSALPFHAAGPFEDADNTTKYLLDDYVSSYTPTLGALINVRSGGSEDNPTVLVVGDTSLRSTKQEISNIRNCGMSTKLFIGKKASHGRVIKAVQQATWVHFACHGYLDEKPFNSSFNLLDRGLTMLDIIKTNLPNAEFAFLSACHTAEQHHNGAHDEVLHLAAAMQFSGFRSVIGSMWELLDEDGPALAKTVYEYINGCDEGEVKYKRAAEGLRKAALELKARDGVQAERWVNLVHIGA